MQLIQSFFREAPNRIILYDYDVRTDGQPVYIGHASNETAQGSVGWTLFKFTYDVSNQVTMVESVGEGIWTSRSSFFS